MDSHMQYFGVVPQSSALGAEITGVDLSQAIDDGTLRQIEDAFHRYSVIFFRSQKITPEQHVAFTRRLGDLEYYADRRYTLPQYPEVMVISNIVENDRPIGISDAGLFWHTDMSYLAKPSLGSLLYAVEVPHQGGLSLGNTRFVSTAAAYDALPERTKKRIAGLTALHSHGGRLKMTLEAGPKLGLRSRDPSNVNQKNKLPDVLHPVVRTHPVNGRKCIFVSEGECTGIVDMPDDEALELIKDLSMHCTQPEYMYEHKWRIGDLLIWDNCSTQHLAVHDYKLPQRRLMYRTTLSGTAPF